MAEQSVSKDLVSDLCVKRMVVFDGEGSLKAYCDLAIGNCFLIRGLRVVEGKKGVFVSMPRQAGKDGKWYESVVAITKRAEAAVSKAILAAYQQSSEPILNTAGEHQS